MATVKVPQADWTRDEVLSLLALKELLDQHFTEAEQRAFGEPPKGSPGWKSGGDPKEDAMRYWVTVWQNANAALKADGKEEITRDVVQEAMLAQQSRGALDTQGFQAMLGQTGQQRTASSPEDQTASDVDAVNKAATAAGVSPSDAMGAFSQRNQLGAPGLNLRSLKALQSLGQIDPEIMQRTAKYARQERQKAAHDVLFRLGKTVDQSITYGFDPAEKPAMTQQDVNAELTEIAKRKAEILKIKGDIESAKYKSQGQRLRTKRELAKLILETAEKNRDTATSFEKKSLDNLDKKLAAANKDKDAAREVLLRASISATDDSAIKKATTAIVRAVARNDSEAQKTAAQAAEVKFRDPVLQYWFLDELIGRADENPTVAKLLKAQGIDASRRRSDPVMFERAALLLGGHYSDFDTMATKAYAHRDSLRDDFKKKDKAVDEIQRQIDAIQLPGFDSAYLRSHRASLRFAEDVFSGDIEESPTTQVISAPPLADIASAQDYVSGVIPGATLSGDQVILPDTGSAISYEEFSQSFPQAQRDISTGAIKPQAQDAGGVDRFLQDLTAREEELSDPELLMSEMRADREYIMRSKMFRDWAAQRGLTDEREAFEFFVRSVGAAARGQQLTDRQKRDAQILSGDAAPMWEKARAMVRTAPGQLGKERRQRRRQAVLGALTPGAKKSRITEGDAVEAAPGTPAAETADPAADPAAEAAAATAPDTGLPKNAITKWTDDTAGRPGAFQYEYTLEENGNITYVNPDPESKTYGKTITIKPGDSNYNNIMKFRAPRYALEYDPDSEYAKAISEARAKEAVEGKDVETALPEQVPFTQEQLAEELALMPDAPALPGETPTLRERIAFGREEREMKPLKEGSRAEVQAKVEKEQEAKSAVIKKAEDAIAEARAKGEEAPEWAILTRDALLDRTLKPQGRGEVIREGSELPSDEAILSLPDETKPALPTTWTDGWAEYTLQPDGKITYKSPSSGKTITVDPEKDKKNYADIMGARKADTTETVAEETPLPEVAPGDYISTQMKEEGRLPLPAGQSKLPRKKAGVAYGMEEDIRLGEEEDSPPVEGKVEPSPDTEKKKRRWLERILSEGTGAGSFPLP